MLLTGLKLYCSALRANWTDQSQRTATGRCISRETSQIKFKEMYLYLYRNLLMKSFWTFLFTYMCRLRLRLKSRTCPFLLERSSCFSESQEVCLTSLDQTLISPPIHQRFIILAWVIISPPFNLFLYIFLLTKHTTVISHTGDLVPPTGPFCSYSAEENYWTSVQWSNWTYRWKRDNCM